MLLARREMSVTDPQQDELARRERALTQQVIESFAQTPDPRLAELIRSLVSHLHAFASEVRLTEPEWEYAIDFLTRTGHISDDRRQEFILLSDVLGLSMLTINISAPEDVAATEPTVFGPFFVRGAPRIQWGEDAGAGAAGEPCWVQGQVTDTAGHPLPGEIEVWQTDQTGRYDVQYDDSRTSGRAALSTDDAGHYGFWTHKPVPYPIPDDGPVGELLGAVQRSPMRPAHIHFRVASPGYQTLVTHVFAADSEYLGSDAVFGVKESLVLDFEPRHEPRGPAGRELDGPWWSLNFPVKLAKLPG
jgi:hydroxyquinol 1,2-dioxygenase